MLLCGDAEAQRRHWLLRHHEGTKTRNRGRKCHHEEHSESLHRAALVRGVAPVQVLLRRGLSGPGSTRLIDDPSDLESDALPIDLAQRADLRWARLRRKYGHNMG